MSSEPKAPGAPAPLSGLPLFYRAPEPLSAAVHGAWRLKDGDVSFAADTPFVPIVVGELAASARSYPIVFAAGNAQPIAVLGLERANLFVTNGAWAEDAYLPAYVRRYPFGFIATANPERFALAIDGASDRVVRTGETASRCSTRTSNPAQRPGRPWRSARSSSRKSRRPRRSSKP